MRITVERYSDDITRVRMSSVSGRLAGYDVSAYLLRGVLIDTGAPWAGQSLLPVVNELAPRGGVVTHWHEDHSGNAALLAERGVPLKMHAQTERTLRSLPSIGLYRRIVWGTPRLLTAPLRDFDLGALTVLETPGHTRDHLVVWDAERGVIASGDLFLGVRVRIAHLHEEPRLLVQSLKLVANLRPTLLLDAHRGIIERPETLLRAKIDWMEETIGQIELLASRGLTEGAIQRQVLGMEELTGYASFGEYSRRAFVQSVLRSG